MRKPQGAFVLVVLVCVVCAYPSAGAQSPAAAAEIAQVSDAYVKASLAADAKAIAALYTEDAVEMPPNHPMVKGRTAIEQYYTKQFGGSAKLQSLALTKIESNASGDIGYEVGTYRQTITDGQHPINDAGKYTVVMTRVGGVWKVAYAIYNSDTPPTAMPTPNP
jgi:uncharacterized protein (TIGR02246 family)